MDAIAKSGSLWVTRIKRNAACRVVRILPVHADEAGFILKDEIIALTNSHPRGGVTKHWRAFTCAA